MNTLRTQLADELTRLAGLSAPHTVSLSGPAGIDLAIDFATVDSLSSSFREIRLHVPALAAADFDRLKQWGDALCRRVTYLLENIGPVELDSDAGEVLIRSTPPDQQADATGFYEVRLQSHSGGRFSLRRYRSEKGAAGRRQVDMQLTHEVLGKLVNDLVDTIPVS